ncbi:MAG: hypothetical protein ABMA64_09620 [Myxococcota bacterium]
MRFVPWICGCLLGSCATKLATTDCDLLCEELIEVCEVAAYPSAESCVAGCRYDYEQGADIAGERACVEQAACDTFAIVECEHAFGAAALSTGAE